MPVLSRASKDLCELVTQVISDYHVDLEAASVSIGILIATPTDREMANDAPHLKFQGRPVVASVKIVSAENRRLCEFDALLKVCDESFRAMDESERIAAIDGAISRLELARDKDDMPKFDEHGRPQLKMRLPDVFVSGFASVIRRHGADAVEARQLKVLFEGYRQLMLAWGSDQGPQDEAPTAADMLGRSA